MLQISVIKENEMKSRAELKREYKERVKPAGIFQIKNTVTGKFLLGSSLNLDGVWNSAKFTLELGNHRNRQLQADWKQYGPEAFVFEVLDQVPDDADASKELDIYETLWVEQLAPFEQGYNTERKIRQA